MTIRETFPTARNGWTTGPYVRYADHPVRRVRVRSNQLDIQFRDFGFGVRANDIHLKYPRNSIFIAREAEMPPIFQGEVAVFMQQRTEFETRQFRERFCGAEYAR